MHQILVGQNQSSSSSIISASTAVKIFLSTRAAGAEEYSNGPSLAVTFSINNSAVSELKLGTKGQWEITIARKESVKEGPDDTALIVDQQKIVQAKDLKPFANSRAEKEPETEGEQDDNRWLN